MYIKIVHNWEIFKRKLVLDLSKYQNVQLQNSRIIINYVKQPKSLTQLLVDKEKLSFLKLNL